MKFRDSFRAQYYLAVLEREITNIVSGFPKNYLYPKDFSKIVRDFSTDLAEELDQLLLPTVVHELHQSRKSGHSKSI